MDKIIAVDTNVLTRYFLRDIPAQTRVADELMELVRTGDIKIWLSPWVIAELIWVLSSVYGKSKEFIIDILKALMATSGVIISNQKLVAAAMLYYIDKNIDFDKLASITENYSSAEIVEGIIETAARIAANLDKLSIDQDLLEAEIKKLKPVV